MSKKKLDDVVLSRALRGKEIPLLTIDARWHELFPQHGKTAEIRKLENRLNKLLKEQGKLVNNVKEMKKWRATLMQNIVNNMDNGEDEESKKKIRQQERDHRLTVDLKEKIGAAEDRLVKIPYEIQATNRELLIAGMRVCYDKLYENEVKIGAVEQWIAETRKVLMERRLENQDMKTENELIYSTMHAIVGMSVMEIFDKDDAKREDEE